MSSPAPTTSPQGPRKAQAAAGSPDDNSTPASAPRRKGRNKAPTRAEASADTHTAQSSPARPGPGTSPEPRAGSESDLARALRAWYVARRRELPWRETPTPYRVWVSEIMLQQTQVVTVVPYFERFMHALPTVDALASAPEDAVLTLWSGLGYYRRARMLHAAAKVVMRDHGGRLPDTVDALQTLPGIGRYTAGAIASIAFGVRAPVLDGNVARVLSRIFMVAEPANSSAGERRLWSLAEGLVPEDASSHNQALMELGALVCSPRNPTCSECPVASVCGAFALGQATAFPVKVARAAPTRVHAVAALIHRGPDVLLARRPADTLLGGLWELPGGELDAPRAPRKATLARALSERLGLVATIGDLVGSVEHQFTHRSLTLEVFRATLDDAQALTPPAPKAFYGEARWLPSDARGSIPLSTLTLKALALAPGTPR